MYSISWTIDGPDDEEIDIDVEYDVDPIVRGIAPTTEFAGEPASGGDVVELIAFYDGQKIDLSCQDRAEIEAWIYATHDYDRRAA